MANHKSALKRNRQSIKRNARNKSIRTNAKNAVQTLRAALGSKKKVGNIGELMKKASSVLARASSKGSIHHKKAARLTSRLQRAVNKL